MAESKIVFVGRLEKDTGLPEFLKYLKNKNEKGKVDFVGDGSLRKECEQYGVVHGFTNPAPFMKKAKLCIPAGYLSYLEAVSMGCKTMVFPNNPLKKDYWEEIRILFEDGQKIKKIPTWDIVANEYLNLYK